MSEQTFEFVSVNYEDNKIGFHDVMSIPVNLRTITQEGANNHVFQKFTYSAFCLLSASFLYDLLWILIMRSSYLGINGRSQSVLSQNMQIYNQYVVYGSQITVVIKLLMLLILTRTVVTFEWRKLLSRYNFYLNFIRFCSSQYVDKLIR